jgi:hypothetical protein
MMSFIRPRWRKPAWIVLAGTVFAVAFVIRGGQHWWLWVSLVAIVVAGRAFFLYVWAGEDDDVGALAGSRADERQSCSACGRGPWPSTSLPLPRSRA